MPVNHPNEFLKSIHITVVILLPFSRASNGRQYSRSWNFQLKISLCSVFQHAECEFQGCSWIWENRVCIIVGLTATYTVGTLQLAEYARNLDGGLFLFLRAVSLARHQQPDNSSSSWSTFLQCNVEESEAGKRKEWHLPTHESFNCFH